MVNPIVSSVQNTLVHTDSVFKAQNDCQFYSELFREKIPNPEVRRNFSKTPWRSNVNPLQAIWIRSEANEALDHCDCG